MNRIIWSDQYLTGFPEVDRQHRQLINELNNLFDHPAVSVDSELISEAMGRVLKLGAEHFKEEEEFFKEIGYKRLQEHAAQHTAFLENLSDIIMSAVFRDPDAPKKLTETVLWLWEQHIKEEIEELKPFAAATSEA